VDPADPISRRTGVLYAVAAYLAWGLLPLYWKALAAVGAIEVVAHRTLWGFVSMAVWVTLVHHWPAVRAILSRPRTMLTLAGSAALIAANWSLYIWAVTHGHLVESSLGYYINPLLNVVLGVAVLSERLGLLQRIAVGLAAVGVAVLTVAHGRFPWVAVALALTFALYGLLRKTVAADAVVGLLVETAILAPLALAYLIAREHSGVAALGHLGTRVDVLLVLAGAITAAPLALFAAGARRLPLSTVGMIQYISPTCQFLLAVLVFREPFGAVQAVAFACIWVALTLLTWDIRAHLARSGQTAEDAVGE
jgi:chloramphenicol-sensitive protein RarD